MNSVKNRRTIASPISSIDFIKYILKPIKLFFTYEKTSASLSVDIEVSEYKQDMREVGVTMGAWEYRMRWYGEEEPIARARAAEMEWL